MAKTFEVFSARAFPNKVSRIFFIMLNEVFDTVKAVLNGLLESAGGVDVVVAFLFAVLPFIIAWKIIKALSDDILNPSIQSYSGRSLVGVNYVPFPISTLVAVFGGKR